jgi:hypothetical protein
MPVQAVVTLAQGETDTLSRTATVKVVRDGEDLFTHTFRYVSEWLKTHGYRPVLGFGYWVKEGTTPNATTQH